MLVCARLAHVERSSCLARSHPLTVGMQFLNNLSPLQSLQEWLKPIMFSGGLGQIDHRHLHKADGEVGVRA